MNPTLLWLAALLAAVVLPELTVRGAAAVQRIPANTRTRSSQ